MGNSTVERCSEYVYEHTTYGLTAVTEVIIMHYPDSKLFNFQIIFQWNLTCGKEYLIAIGNSLFMFGVMFGSIGFGELSDRLVLYQT